MESETTNDSLDLDNLMAWFYQNRKPLIIGGTIVSVALIAFALFNWNKNQNELNANAAIFALPSLVGAGEKATEARAEDFQKIANEYSGTRVADRAEIIAAGVLFTDGKYAEAEKQFSKFLGEHEGSPLQAEAALGVAASLEAQGKINEAVLKYQELIAKHSTDNVVPPAKLTLARLLETQSKPEAALKLYDDLMLSKNPYDPWAGEARERRELLLQKFPNLKSKPAAAATVEVPALKPAAAITNNTLKK